MKTRLTICISLGIMLSLKLAAYNGQEIENTLMQGNQEREYLLYLPDNYAGDTLLPLILCLHGDWENDRWMLIYTDIAEVADTAGCLLVLPQGLEIEEFSTDIPFYTWNVTGDENYVNDIDFITQMLDTVVLKYPVDTNRIYALGHSRGGFLSYRLACDIGDRITAIGVNAGAMHTENIIKYAPIHPTPILHSHGTSDNAVHYNGTSTYWSVNECLGFWMNINSCTDTTRITLPDIDPTDQLRVSHHIFSGGISGARIELMQIANGGHDWPGYNGTMDIEFAAEAWNFFYPYRLDSLMLHEITETTPSTFPGTSEFAFNYYPNPVKDILIFKGNFPKDQEFSIYSIMGNRIIQGIIETNIHPVQMSHLPEGLYFLDIAGKSYRIIKVE